MAVTLWSDDPARGPADLAQVAHSLEVEFKRVPGTRDVYSIGAPQRRVVVTLDAARLASYGLTVADLMNSLRAANVVQQLGERVGPQGTAQVSAGTLSRRAPRRWRTWSSASMRAGRCCWRTSRRCSDGADLPDSYVWYGTPAGKAGPAAGTAPAVTIAIAKKPGSNAADITTAVAQRLGELRGELIPQGVHAEITRDYGKTATDKAAEADPEADLRHLLGGAAGAVRAGLARGHRGRHRGGADAGA